MYNLFYLHEREFLNKELHITEKWGNGLYQQTLEDSKETIMDNKLFSRMQYEPCVLIIGKEYKKVKDHVYGYIPLKLNTFGILLIHQCFKD